MLHVSADVLELELRKRCRATHTAKGDKPHAHLHREKARLFTIKYGILPSETYLISRWRVTRKGQVIGWVGKVWERSSLKILDRRRWAYWFVSNTTDNPNGVFFLWSVHARRAAVELLVVKADPKHRCRRTWRGACLTFDGVRGLYKRDT